MTTQPEALRLADAIERYNAGICSQSMYEDYSEAAAELRRLHEVNQELLEALKEANKELEYLNDPKGFVSMRQERIMEKARAAIAKATGESK